jgi:hypothetical protein
MQMSIARTDRPEPTVPVINPTEDDLSDPVFQAIWRAIKAWDIQREPGLGYAGANGSDVMTIIAALRAMEREVYG